MTAARGERAIPFDVENDETGRGIGGGDMGEREKAPDCIKGIGILLMVAGHAGISDMARQWIYGFHMPLFFLLAGFLFRMDKWKQRGFASLMKNRAKSYLIPYAVLFAVNLIVYSAYEIVYLGKGLDCIGNYIFAGLYSHDANMPNCAPLWFLTCLYVAYLYFWILVRQKNRIRRFLLAGVYLVALHYVNEIENFYGITQLPWHIDTALIASVFMLIGYELRPLREIFLQSKWRVTICVCGVILGTIVTFVNDRIIMVVNQYGNMVLFVAGAAFMSIVVYDISVRICAARNKLSGVFMGIFSFWGRNTLFFLGFNYMINLVVYLALLICRCGNSMVYTVLDILCVMTGCSLMAILWKRVCGIHKKYVSEK